MQTMAQRRTLTTTSFALLAQLARRPWTAYELSHQMTRNFRFFWPRAESQLYAEMKALAHAGFADATRRKKGRRVTTTYAITQAGRGELAAWLGRRAAPPSLEFETLLRVFISPLGSVADVRHALDSMCDYLDEAFAVADIVGREYVAGTSEFQDQVHARALIFDFLASFFSTVDDWRARTEREVASWRSTRGTAAERARAVNRIERILEARVSARARRTRETRA
jgi:DNA-binding PadR family transcriptional regulator